MYRIEQQMIERRWERTDRFKFLLQADVFRGIRLMGIVIVITFAIATKDLQWKIIVADMIAFSLTLVFAKWIIRR